MTISLDSDELSLFIIALAGLYRSRRLGLQRAQAREKAGRARPGDVSSRSLELSDIGQLLSKLANGEGPEADRRGAGRRCVNSVPRGAHNKEEKSVGNDKLTTTTQQLVVSINLAGAVRAGGYEYGRRMVAVPAGVVAQLSPAARDVLARLLADGDPPVLREASEHGTYYSDSVAKLPAASWEAVAAYLDQVAAMWAGYEARRATERVEREAREAAEREQWVQQALAGGIPALLYRGSTYDEWRLTESTWADDPRLAGLRADAQVEADVRNAQARVDKEQAGAAKEAAKILKEAERLAWIAEHGSTLLKRCVAENISCGGVYLDERLALERPGWQWEDEVEGASRDPHNPGLAAFQLLDEARETLPEAERAEARLMFWVRGCDCAERGYFDEHDPYNCGRWKGYVVGASFLGKAIVYGADEED